MGGKINYFDKPLTVNIQDWIRENEGMVAAGLKTDDRQRLSIIATQKADCASTQMKKYAKEHGAVIMISISDGELNAID